MYAAKAQRRPCCNHQNAYTCPEVTSIYRDCELECSAHSQETLCGLLGWLERRIRELIHPLNVKMRLANRSRGGINLSNDLLAVCSNSHAPMAPPTRLVRVRVQPIARETVTSLRYAKALAAAAGQSANVAVAFAGTGDTPAMSNAGNVTKVPPPATAFRAPPLAEAAASRSI